MSQKFWRKSFWLSAPLVLFCVGYTMVAQQAAHMGLSDGIFVLLEKIILHQWVGYCWLVTLLSYGYFILSFIKGGYACVD